MKRDLSLLALVPGLQAARDALDEQIETIIATTFGRGPGRPPLNGPRAAQSPDSAQPYNPLQIDAHVEPERENVRKRKKFSAKGLANQRHGQMINWMKRWREEARIAGVPLEDVIPQNSKFRTEILALVAAEKGKKVHAVAHKVKGAKPTGGGSAKSAANLAGIHRAQRTRRWKEWEVKAKTLGVRIDEVIPMKSVFRKEILHEVRARERREAGRMAAGNNVAMQIEEVETNKGAFEQTT